MNLHVSTYIVAGLTALLVLGGCLLSVDSEPTASSNESALHIIGSDSSLAAPMFKNWFAVYARDHADLALSYDSVGSGEGIDRFLAGTVDIGATEAPLRADEAVIVGGPYLQIPVTSGMIAVAYNLPGIDEPLNLSRDVYVVIFRGTLHRWNDPHIVAANPGIALPPS